jgi:mono/diheme cytochrome c family protein
MPHHASTRAAALVSIVTALLSLAPPALFGQGESAKSVLAGAYTEEQATSGAALYRANCAACHAKVQQTGKSFQESWGGRSLYDLFTRVRTTMPFDDPGRLSAEEYALVLAYLLKLNGYPAGSDPLPTSADELKRIRIDATANAPQGGAL